MTLDDRIKNSRRTADNRGRGRGRGRGGGRGQGRSFGGGRPMGPPRRGPLAVNARPSAYSIAKASSTSMDIFAFGKHQISVGTQT